MLEFSLNKIFKPELKASYSKTEWHSTGFQRAWIELEKQL